MDGGSVDRILKHTKRRLIAGATTPAKNAMRDDLEHAGIEYEVAGAVRNLGKGKKLERLVSKSLYSIYAKHILPEEGDRGFARSMSEKSGSSGGPYVRFVTACLREMGIVKREAPPLSGDTDYYCPNCECKSCRDKRRGIQPAIKPLGREDRQRERDLAHRQLQEYSEEYIADIIKHAKKQHGGNGIK